MRVRTKILITSNPEKMSVLRRETLALALAALATLATGCKHSLSQYIAPRVTGRVLDAGTHQPVSGVRVHRLGDNPPPAPGETPRGAETLKRTPGERTRTDGTFVLASKRDLAILRRVKWYSATLSFTHPRYQELTRSYTATNATETSSGEPWVNAGDILLSPKADE
jgi:hypothetical protein